MARILVVDDHPDGRDFLATLLGYRGHTIELASDGEEALQVIARSPPDLVVSDILMPRIDGYELVRRMRGDPLVAATPVVFYTAGYGDEPARALAASAGVVQFLQKPADPRIILGIIDAALGNQAHAGPAPQPPPTYEQQHLELLTSSLSRRVDELQLEVAERTRAEAAVTALNAALEQSNLKLQAEITERERVQDQLLQVLKLESLGELTGGIVHDFNNLLTVVMGNLELIVRRNTDAKLIRLLDGAQEAAKRGARLTEQLLTFARKQRLTPMPLDLTAVLSDINQLLASTVGPSVAIQIVSDAKGWLALADRNQIEMVFLNLAANARDAMDGQGELVIRVAHEQVDASENLGDFAAGDYVSVTMTDNGSGMTPEVLARAIEPFYTTKDIGKGTGLGLSMVHGVSKQSGGALVIESERGRGTTVKIYLPRTTDAQSRSVDEANAASSTGDRLGTVLLVDDDEQVRVLTEELLLDMGYDVVVHDCGRDALMFLDTGADIDLLLVDYGMPGMNGAEVAGAARERRPLLPIVFVTGYASGLGRGEHESIPVLRKPFKLRDFEIAISDALCVTPRSGSRR